MLWLAGACNGGDNQPDASPGDLRGDQPAGKLDGAALPGCPAGCAQNQTCRGGKCVTVGPTRSCGTSRYGTGLPSTGVIHVDGSFSGTGKGTAAKPYRRIADALAAYGPGSRAIAVAEGTYTEQLTIDRDLWLACRCASKVTITGRIKIKVPLSRPGVMVTIDGCSVRPASGTAKPAKWSSCDADLEPRGISALSGAGSIALRIRDSVLSGWCVGAYFNASSSPGSSSSLCVARSRISANVKGLDVVQAPALSSFTFPECKGLPESVAASLSHLAENKDYGVFTRVAARGLALESNLVERSGHLGSSSGGLGFGVFLGNTDAAVIKGNRFANNNNRGLAMKNLSSVLATKILIQDNLLLGNRGAGIALQQLSAQKPVVISGNHIEATGVVPGQPGGDGIQVSLNAGKLYDVTVEHNKVSSSKRMGVFLQGVGGKVRSNTVQGSSSHGILLQASKAAVGPNTFSGNGASNVSNTASKSVKVADLPLPIP